MTQCNIAGWNASIAVFQVRTRMSGSDEFTTDTLERSRKLMTMFKYIEMQGTTREFRHTFNVLDGLLYVTHESKNNLHFYNFQWFGERGTQAFGLRKIGNAPWLGPYHSGSTHS